jgi:hypothetical protein
MMHGNDASVDARMAVAPTAVTGRHPGIRRHDQETPESSGNPRAGLAAAKKDQKPGPRLLHGMVPAQLNYSKEFHDEKVVAQSKKFVMIRLDKDKNAEISKKYAPDGEYIPRTYFLSSDGTLDATLTAPRSEYKYFYDERDPAQLLTSMDAALKKLK